MHTAIPQYTAGVISIKQYVYSDSAVADIECPLQLGRLTELYGFSWHGVIGDSSGPITNGTLGVYWLAEENNRTLHVNISAPENLRNFQCIGAVQACSTSSSCRTERRNSPTITVLNIIGKCFNNINLSLYEALNFRIVVV